MGMSFKSYKILLTSYLNIFIFETMFKKDQMMVKCKSNGAKGYRINGK